MLTGAGHQATVIDFSSAQLAFLKQFGIHAYYGDATRPDLLHAAGIADAKLLVVAIDGKDQITELVRYVHHHYPDVHIIARAVDRAHVYDLWHAGCRDIIREYYDSALRMGRSSLVAMGAENDVAEAAVDAFNTLDRKFMVEIASHYDPTIPPFENEAMMKKFNEVRAERQEAMESQMQGILAEETDT